MATLPPPTPPLPAPIEAPIEVERKWLITKDNAAALLKRGCLSTLRIRTIEQGYVADDPVTGTEVRVRKSVWCMRPSSDGMCDATTFTLTAKSSGGMVRSEVEVPIDAAAFEGFWAMTLGQHIAKTRHQVALDRADGLVVEVDHYLDRLDGLVMVEVKFFSRETARLFVPPPEFGREVTSCSEYKNKALAQNSGVDFV